MAVLVVEDLGERAVGGAPLRWRGLAAALARHQPLVTIETDALRREVGCGDRCDCPPASLVAYGSGRPDPYARYGCSRAVAALSTRIAALPRQPVIVSHLRLHRYLGAALAAGATDVAIDLHNAEADLYFEMLAHPFAVRWAGLMAGEGEAIRAVEAWACRAARLVITCSDRDADLIRERYSPRATAVIPNAVAVGPPPEPGPAATPDLLFLGAMQWFPNLHAALHLVQEIYPLLKRVLAHSSLTVAGHAPPPMLADWIAGTDAVLIADPPAPRDLLAGRVLAVPLHFGGGTRLKILEAFAHGCPVISTAKGAEGLAAQPDVHYLAADTPRQFVAQLIRLTCDPIGDRRRRRAAYDLVAADYSWPAIASSAGPVLATLSAAEATDRVAG